jgi:hypothetical protein
MCVTAKSGAKQRKIMRFGLRGLQIHRKCRAVTADKAK